MVKHSMYSTMELVYQRLDLELEESSLKITFGILNVLGNASVTEDGWELRVRND